MSEHETPTGEPINDELARHLDWSFWGTGMADTFREPLAEAMLAGITPEQREQANALITRWRDHREFVGRDKYEAQKAEIDRLTGLLAEARSSTLAEADEKLSWMLEQTPEGNPRRRGIAFSVGVLQELLHGATDGAL